MSINRREHAIGLGWAVAIGTVGLVALVTTAIPAIRHLRETPPPPPPPLRLVLSEANVGSGTSYPFGLVVAPDGRRIAFPAAREGRVRLWLRDVTSDESHALPTADGAAMPFWSRDGSRLGYFATGHLHVLDIASDTDSELIETPSPRGGAWLASGDILLAPNINGGLMRYRADTRSTEPFTELDHASGELSHGMPIVSSDGRHVLFHVLATTAARAGIWWASVDTPVERRRLVGSNAHGIVAGEYLLFANDTALMAQRIDLDGGAVLGRPSAIATSVGHGPLGQLFASIAEDGPLFYGHPVSTLRTLTWVDRTGAALGTVGGAADSWDLRIAPIGSRVAVTQVDAQLGTLDVWAYEGSRPLPMRISAAIDADDQAVWSSDATQIAWVRGRRTLMTRGAQAMLPEETIRRFDGTVRLWDWSRDGRWLIVGLTDPATYDDLWIVSANGEQEPQPLLQTPFRETDAALSPDGQWIAFASDESGRAEIYLDTFPELSHRSRLSLGGGTMPRWRGDGREIVFRRGRELHAVTLASNGGSFQATATTMLFEAPADVRAYDMTADGTRFLLNLPASATSPPVQTIVNWKSLLLTNTP